ncbi:hypothetical protein ACFT9I_02270 [Streptomyces sp. NPDC057137]|uniref:hypothetical protein n=1 Tax=Streptomyces sp. NPDC057137 TaxID=3346030 RepID=UPI0036325C87
MGTQAVTGRLSRLHEACCRLDGADREALQRELYAACRPRTPAPQGTVHHLALGLALVHLRRTGADRYTAEAHLRREAAEGRGVPAETADRVRRTAIPLGAPVHILGERHSGTVVHLTILRDLYEKYPAPWFVVLSVPLATCRAHGADEIEPVDGRTPPIHRPRNLTRAQDQH